MLLEKSSDLIEKEAAANLASRDWQSVPVSGRPLDPRHDFGQHALEAAAAEVYLADARLPADLAAADKFRPRRRL